MSNWNYYKAWERQIIYMMYEDFFYFNTYTTIEKYYINEYLNSMNTNDDTNNISLILQDYVLLDNIKDIVKNCNILFLLKNNKIIEIKKTIIDNIYKLSINKNTYTSILNLLDFTDFHQLIILKIDIYVIQLIENKYGCHIIQKIIKLIDYKNITSLLKKIYNYFSVGYKSPSANYVYQLIITKYQNNNYMDLPYIYDNIKKISLHQYGCRIICRILEQKNNNIIINNIITNFDCLCVNRYSRFVIECLINNVSSDILNLIRKKITKNIINYSVNNHSSFIIRKLIDKKVLEIHKIYTIQQIIYLLNHKNTYYINIYILNSINKEMKNKIKNIFINKESENNKNYNTYLELLNM
uniref:PUM-HD domain-containing protein n=1 Tax=viral metagenome TaxID=1070528 RepID=A0A6C0H8Q5_9ZZZZ